MEKRRIYRPMGFWRKKWDTFSRNPLSYLTIVGVSAYFLLPALFDIADGQISPGSIDVKSPTPVATPVQPEAAGRLLTQDEEDAWELWLLSQKSDHRGEEEVEVEVDTTINDSFAASLWMQSQFFSEHGNSAEEWLAQRQTDAQGIQCADACDAELAGGQ